MVRRTSSSYRPSWPRPESRSGDRTLWRSWDRWEWPCSPWHARSGQRWARSLRDRAQRAGCPGTGRHPEEWESRRSCSESSCEEPTQEPRSSHGQPLPRTTWGCACRWRTGSPSHERGYHRGSEPQWYLHRWRRNRDRSCHHKPRRPCWWGRPRNLLLQPKRFGLWVGPCFLRAWLLKGSCSQRTPLLPAELLDVGWLTDFAAAGIPRLRCAYRVLHSDQRVRPGHRPGIGCRAKPGCFA